MGHAPNDTEVRMFFILTLGMVIFGIILGVMSPEFLFGDVTTNDLGTPDSLEGVEDVIGSLLSMFAPFLGVLYLPVWLVLIIGVIQLFWYYLLYCIVVRPLTPWV